MTTLFEHRTWYRCVRHDMELDGYICMRCWKEDSVQDAAMPFVPNQYVRKMYAKLGLKMNITRKAFVAVLAGLPQLAWRRPKTATEVRVLLTNQFTVGDRVRVTNVMLEEEEPLIGKCGTVLHVGSPTTIGSVVRVRMDEIPPKECWFFSCDPEVVEMYDDELEPA